MDTIGTFGMAITFASHGLIVAIHKHYALEDWQQFAKGACTNAFHCRCCCCCNHHSPEVIAHMCLVLKMSDIKMSDVKKSSCSHVKPKVKI